MIIKDKEERRKILTAASINSDCLLMLKDLVEPGISSLEVDRKAEEFYTKNKVKPAFKGVPGIKFPYPSTINFQINDQVVHNIPSEDQIVEEGDLVSIDTGCIYDGFYADHATSFGVGKITETDENLLYIGRMSVIEGAQKCIAGNTIGDIGYIQQGIIELAGFSVVREFCGHEIGRSLWEDLKIPGYGIPGKGRKVLENQVLCIENQVCEHDNKVYTERNGWSVYTQDGSKAVTFEHMVIVGKKKAEIITRF